ncbi:MAG TPA: long-chain fatty acid--CoA ligase [Ilumatobacteraceae bacterium]|nr:long-chain fatty acid--CoA ligase [Ilumatobacteraceae bacterium]
MAVESDTHRLSHDDLRNDALELRSQVERGGVLHLRTDDAVVVAAAVLALDGWAGEVHLLPAGLVVESSAGAESVVAGAPTRWVLYTSGTTGEPKPIAHTLASLSRTVVRDGADVSSMVWGLLYDPNRMAGIQVVLQSVLSGARLVAPRLTDPLGQRIAALVAGGVDALSATPTLWRRILQLPNSADLALRQITLGGEIADQPVLDALRHRYPTARIVHVFASTETGAAFSVSDGRAGFPMSYLRNAPRGIGLDIRDGILHVHSPGVSAAGPDGFASTGDIVEIVDDRVLFRGRASGVVNVGGANVWPEEVEELLRSHPAVADAVVTATPNPLAGNLLVARVVAAPDAERAGLGKLLRAFVREHAPSTHVPATVKVVDELETSAAGKVVRA